jgi:rubrerythrin
MPERQEARSAAKGWVCPVDGTTAPHLGDEHAVACPKCGRKMVRRV